MKPNQQIDLREKLCPLFKKPCEKHWENCAWKMKNARQYGDGTIVDFYGCALFWLADEQQNMTNRLAMVQTEMGEVKNANIYHAMAALGSKQGKEGLVKMVDKNQAQRRLS